MSANDEVIIRRKQNGLYDVRHCQAEDGTIEENTLEIIADDVDGLGAAVETGNRFIEECEEEGYPVEYGLDIRN